jgi:hypothetical protein
LRCWRESGVEDILGIDGDYVERDQLMIPPTRFRSADLCQPIRCERNFDLAMSLEVAEHLPESRAQSIDLRREGVHILLQDGCRIAFGIDGDQDRYDPIGPRAELLERLGFHRKGCRTKIWTVRVSEVDQHEFSAEIHVRAAHAVLIGERKRTAKLS